MGLGSVFLIELIVNDFWVLKGGCKISRDALASRYMGHLCLFLSVRLKSELDLSDYIALP